MNYLKSLFFNFLTVFFSNHILPGIDVINQTKLPHLGSDLLFAVILGLLNSLIFPVFKALHRPITISRIILTAIILNFAVYAILKVLPLGIHIASVEGYLLASFVVTLGSILTNFMELKAHKPLFHDHHPEHPTHHL